MDFGQFSIMFKALFLEGFARPFEGVRTILRVLLEKYRQAGGERRMKCGVKQIVAKAGRVQTLVLDSGETISADHVFSSIGARETALLTGAPSSAPESEPGQATLSFVETITVLDRQPAALGWGGDTIVFFNDSNSFHYERPEGQVDVRSGVICLPNNFDFGRGRLLSEGFFRCTCLARHDLWAGLSEERYQSDKKRWYLLMQASARRFLPVLPNTDLFADATLAVDMFTPRTIQKFTGHLEGAIYGAVRKQRQGRTELSNLYLCGTDQGFLGIVGAMLSGISMANYHVLQSKQQAG
jgi:phytoene dehydrogenase-like protein